ncbi:MAG: ester cyclase [Thioclava marina]|jgi:SnoaL-like polyketide cyclase.|uniref:SnoaL-like domain-containing protein n=1 Tax=Thioclava marina TaxID=1915077 RepID=A0ABX3MMU7_9RHOB|nr:MULTISPECIES: nuclear transport factor 2 family protein [Thioclava]TNE89564.1 MAG: nuclear transport factor 2 family protein [Paracoccaceae bacterium]MBC7144137.1 ester cyclase [Thioclava marina]MBD3803781.1 ester cyclase [Thioclava sp.]OOY12518.1 hypothetical protein BMG00_01285 [Thioclava marina]OOY28538.1 hypothetical protein BMI90_07680 [Thioclava sp. L04-15]
MSRRERIETWLNAVWGKGELDRIDALFEDSAQANGLMPGLELRPEEFHELVPALRAHLKDIEITILRQFETSDWLWLLLRIEGRSSQTGQSACFTGQLSMRFAGEKIVEAYNNFDVVALFEALGVMPRDTVALCLSGESFV